MVGSVGMQCCTIYVSILGTSSYDHENSFLNSVSKATNAYFSEMVRVLPTHTILGLSSVP